MKQHLTYRIGRKGDSNGYRRRSMLLSVNTKKWTGFRFCDNPNLHYNQWCYNLALRCKPPLSQFTFWNWKQYSSSNVHFFHKIGSFFAKAWSLIKHYLCIMVMTPLGKFNRGSLERNLIIGRIPFIRASNLAVFWSSKN